MKTWQLLHIEFWSSKIAFFSTDEQAATNIINTVKLYVPGSTSSKPIGDTICIEHIRDRGLELKHYIITMLCRDGWEPFAVDRPRIYFRREEETGAKTM